MTYRGMRFTEEEIAEMFGKEKPLTINILIPGRASDVRKALKPHLMDVKAESDPCDRSRVVYRLVG